MKKYKYRNKFGSCHHKGNSLSSSKEKMPCVENGCPYVKECVTEMNKNKKYCFWCKNGMGNSHHNIDGYSIHLKCECNNSTKEIFKKIKRINPDYDIDASESKDKANRSEE